MSNDAPAEDRALRPTTSVIRRLRVTSRVVPNRHAPHVYAMSAEHAAWIIVQRPSIALTGLLEIADLRGTSIRWANDGTPRVGKADSDDLLTQRHFDKPRLLAQVKAAHV